MSRGYVYLELRRTLRYGDRPTHLEPTNAYLEVRRTLRYVQRPDRHKEINKHIEKSCQLND